MTDAHQISIHDEIDALLLTHIARGDFPSAAYLVAEAGAIRFANAVGFAVRAPEPHAVRLDTIYDLASLTKPLVTSLSIARLIERGRLDLDTEVASHLPEFRRATAQDITVRRLLTHTSGLPAWRPLYALTTPDTSSVLDFIAGQAGSYPSGSRVVYSDLGFITLGFLIERLAQTPLAEYARAKIFEPLELKRTFFNPPPALRREIAASEIGNFYERELCLSEAAGMSADATQTTTLREHVIWGEVHDGNAHFLGGAAGHAGLFSTVHETARLAEQFVARRTSLLAAATCSMFRENMTPGLNEARSAGWQLSATPESTAGASLPPRAFGHTGFAGTSLWIDAERERIFVLLTNRTHDRATPFANINSVRRRFHTLAVERLDAHEA